MSVPVVRYAFFCEDLRAEEGGKTTALALFGTRIIVHSTPPGRLRSLAFHAHVFNPENQGHPYRVRISGAPLPRTIEQQGELSATPGKHSHNINVILMSVPLFGPGVVTGEITIEADPEVRATVELEIRFDQPDTARRAES